MRIFLYATTKSPGLVRFTNELYRLVPSHEIIVLPEGCKFISHLALKMRSGDLVILYAENNDELAELMRLADEYEPFRIVLVLGSFNPDNEDRVQGLHPCFVTSADGSLEELCDVIEKISHANKSAGPDQMGHCR